VKNKESFKYCDIIGSVSASRCEVVEAGLKLLAMIYGGKPDDSLNNLRYVMYMNFLATSKTKLNPERLPPTENAAQFHALRVHFQVVQWHSLMDVELNAEDWGWKNVNGQYVAIDTDLNAAPDNILNIVTCRCKMQKKKPCSTQVC
jgi:hypothetical protein